eukprot:5917665-Pyramimonas_sp.AAC.1
MRSPRYLDGKLARLKVQVSVDPDASNLQKGYGHQGWLIDDAPPIMDRSVVVHSNNSVIPLAGWCVLRD